MKFVIKKIPKIAVYCYLVGFVLIAFALYHYFSANPSLSVVNIQQLFIGGAIVVACGSIINTLYQFKRKN